MESFSAGQCPWAVTGEGGQLLRAAVAVRAAYTETTINQRVRIGTYNSEDEAKAVFRKLRIALSHDDKIFNVVEHD